MFTVTGTIDSVAYRVGVHDEPPDEPEALGVVMGSTNALTAIEAHVGDEVRATPTSEALTLDPADPDSVYAFLMSHTAVGAVEGDVPNLLPEDAHPLDVH